MNWIEVYTRDKRRINGIENAIISEVCRSDEYQEFTEYFEGQKTDLFIADKCTEEGMLEVQLSKVYRSDAMEWTDRILFSFYPDSIEKLKAASREEAAYYRIMNMDAFWIRDRKYRISMEAELYNLSAGRSRSPIAAGEADTRWLSEEIARNLAWNSEKSERRKLNLFFLRREAMLRKTLSVIILKEPAQRFSMLLL